MHKATRTLSDGPPRSPAHVLVSVLLLAPALLAPAEAQDRAPPPDGRRPGAIPVDPDAPAFLGRVAPDGLRPLSGRPHRFRLFPVFPVVSAGWGRAEGAPPEAAATRDTGRTGRADGSSPDAAPEAEPPRQRPEGPCLELAVRLAGGGVHRLRIDGGTLDVRAPGQLTAQLRERMAADGVLVVRGMYGVGLHLAADRVAGLEVERCPGINVR